MEFEAVLACTELEDCFDLLSYDGKLAVLVPRNVALNQQRKRDLDISCFPPDQNFCAMYVTLAFARDFQFMSRVNDIIQRLLEQGLFVKWERDYRARTYKWEDNETTDISFGHILGAMLSLATGYSLAFATLLLEIFVHKYRKYNRVFKILDKLGDPERYTAREIFQ